MEKREKKWYAIYTKPRWEKKVDTTLIQKGIESFCPLQKVERRWSDRKKVIEEPVFKSYVFVCILEDDFLKVLQTNGVLNFVHFLGHPAIIKNSEIQLIKEYLYAAPSNISIINGKDFKMYDKVIIKKGVFMDNTGTIIKTSHKKIYVQLESLDQFLVVEFPVNHLALMQKTTKEKVEQHF